MKFLSSITITVNKINIKIYRSFQMKKMHGETFCIISDVPTDSVRQMNLPMPSQNKTTAKPNKQAKYLKFKWNVDVIKLVY